MDTGLVPVRHQHRRRPQPGYDRVVQSGDILSLNTFPMIFGCYTALERTLFCDHVDDASLDIWEKNVAVHRRGLELIRPGARCKDIAAELNEMYAGWDLLRYRSFGYGHSFGVLCHYYGPRGRRGAARGHRHRARDRDGRLDGADGDAPGRPAGAGGYREHDILIVQEDGAENITGFPFGPRTTSSGTDDLKRTPRLSRPRCLPLNALGTGLDRG